MRLAVVKPETRDEWMAVWTALQQYVDNSDPEEIGSPLPPEEARVFEAAKTILARFDAAMAELVA